MSEVPLYRTHLQFSTPHANLFFLLYRVKKKKKKPEFPRGLNSAMLEGLAEARVWHHVVEQTRHI